MGLRARERTTFVLLNHFDGWKSKFINMLIAEERLNLEGLNFGRNMGINESVVYANFKNSRSRDRDLKKTKTVKMVIYMSANLSIRL